MSRTAASGRDVVLYDSSGKRLLEQGLVGGVRDGGWARPRNRVSSSAYGWKRRPTVHRARRRRYPSRCVLSQPGECNVLEKVVLGTRIALEQQRQSESLPVTFFWTAVPGTEPPEQRSQAQMDVCLPPPTYGSEERQRDGV